MLLEKSEAKIRHSPTPLPGTVGKHCAKQVPASNGIRSRRLCFTSSYAVAIIAWR